MYTITINIKHLVIATILTLIGIFSIIFFYPLKDKKEGHIGFWKVTLPEEISEADAYDKMYATRHGNHIEISFGSPEERLDGKGDYQLYVYDDAIQVMEGYREVDVIPFDSTQIIHNIVAMDNQ